MSSNDLDARLRLARSEVHDFVDMYVEDGNIEIDRMIADAKAWIRYWPEPVPNRRSSGQFLRHMRAGRLASTQDETQS